jgi:hypothetical protein
MTQEIIEMAQECRLIGMRPHLDGIYSEALVAFAKLVADKALAEHAMREVQRLGQEIEQDHAYGYASRLAVAIWQKHYMKDAPKWKPLDTTEGVLTQIDNMTCGLVREKPAQPEQEPVIGKWSLREVYFDEDGEPISHRSPPQRTEQPAQRTWVGLTEQDLDYLCNLAYTGDEEFALAVQAKLMEKNA